MTTKYVDYLNGDDGTGDGSAGNPYATIAVASAGLTGGDEVRVAQTPMCSLGAATWTDDSGDVVLDTAVTELVCDCEATWTDSANVTSALDSATEKMGDYALLVTIDAAFTTGLAAYYTITETDLSGYEQLTFWFKPNVDTTAGDFKLALCSDTAGAAPVNAFDIPNGVANQWRACTVDKGVALGASIKSIALYVINDIGASQLRFDNINACKARDAAGCLTLTSVISKNSGTEAWWPIRGINGTTISLGRSTTVQNYSSEDNYEYIGTTENVTTYAMQAIVHANPTSTYEVCDTFEGSGSSLQSWLTISGGWNLGTETKVGLTTLTTGMAVGILLSVGTSTGAIDISDFAFLFGARALHAGANGDYGMRLSDLYLCAPDLTAIHSINSVYFKGENIHMTNAGGESVWGVGIFDSTPNQRTNPNTCFLTNFYAYNYETLGPLFTSGGTFRNIYTYNCNYAMATLGETLIYNLQTDGTASTADIVSYGGNCRVQNMGSFSTTPATFAAIYADGGPSSISFTSGDDHRIYTGIGNIIAGSSVRHTASGLSWEFSPTVDTDATMSLRRVIARPLCKANTAVTVTAWFRRTNTGVTAKLVVPEGQLSGLTTEQSDSMAAAADTWEQLSVTFTPTQTGVVEIEAQVYGGTTYSVYVDDVEFS